MSFRPHVVILGYGNTLRGDDAFGHRAAERLSDLARQRVRVVAAHQLTIDHAEIVADAELVIFIDASRDGTAGEMRVDVVVAQPGNPDAVMTHHLTPQTLLTLSRTLYGGSPEAYLVTVTGESFELSETMSPAVEGRLDPAVHFVRALVDEHERQSQLWAPV